MRLDYSFWYEVFYRYNWKDEVREKLKPKIERKFFIKRTCACCGKTINVILNKKKKVVSGAKFFGAISMNTGRWGYSTFKDGVFTRLQPWYKEFYLRFKDYLIIILGQEKKAEYWECDPCFRLGAWRGLLSDVEYERKEAGKPKIPRVEYIPPNCIKISGTVQTEVKAEEWINSFIEWIESRKEFFGGGVQDLDKDCMPLKKKTRKKRKRRKS